MTRAQLREVDLPEFGYSDHAPELPLILYAERLERLRTSMTDAGLDYVLVYADREHSANISFLTGFDPRFEEALLVVRPDDDPLVLVGNECVGMAGAAPLPIRVELHQDLSLPSQPRDRSRPLADVLRSEGVRSGARIGVVGWKEFVDVSMIEIPAFIVDGVRNAVGESGLVTNANQLFSGSESGLRVVNEVEQLAAFEHAACHTSAGVRRVITGLEPGMREDEAVRLLQWNGSPLSCHLMLSSGPRASLGLLGPTSRAIGRGDRFTTAYGIWGALNCRAGFVVADASELPASISDYIGVLVGPYFEAIGEWYEALRVGQTGGALFEIVDRHLGDDFFGIFLNPGHLLHLDEWVNSPIWKDSPIELRSGMALQSDVIPATGTDYFTTNIEDGLAIGDRDLRDRFAASYPDAWLRIQARKRFMRESLGIDLHDDVMPFSNIPAFLSPFLLSPNRVMTLST